MSTMHEHSISSICTIKTIDQLLIKPLVRSPLKQTFQIIETSDPYSDRKDVEPYYCRIHA